MFVYLNRWEREKEEIKRKQEKLDDRQDYSYLNYLSFWSRSVQLSWIPQLSHLLIPKLLLDLGRSEYRYSYINYLTFWYQTVQCTAVYPYLIFWYISVQCISKILYHFECYEYPCYEYLNFWSKSIEIILQTWISRYQLWIVLYNSISKWPEISRTKHGKCNFVVI